MGAAMLGKRRGARLTAADWERFGPKFLQDLEALWPDWRFRLADLTPDAAEPDELELLLQYKGRLLGRLFVTGPDQARRPEEEARLYGVIRLALDNMSLRKALLTDRETGLYSREYFRNRLWKALRKRRREGAARSLSMDGEPAPELLLGLVELREAADPSSALAALAGRLAECLPARHLSRLGTRRLGFLAEARPEEFRLGLENVLDGQLAAEPDSRPVAAWVRYPHDLGEDEGGPDAGPDWARSQADDLEERARTALFQARQSRAAGQAVAFGDLLENHGQVVQVLPQDRVVVNLGRSMGAAAGQVFLVSSPPDRPGVEPEYKGEVTLFEAADNYSFGYLSGLKPARRIVAGDLLTFSRHLSEPADPGERRRPPALGFMADLPGREDFLAGLAKISSQPLALALARLDGFEKSLAVLGREEGERLAAVVLEKVAEGLPAAPLRTLWQADILALAWPGGAQAELGPLAHRLAAELKEAGPVSFGLVFSPGWSGPPEGLMEDGRKALNEASFSGYGQVAVFGPLALNISGDRLFEGGDLTAAVREYERGLALAPDHLNLLNSLGVCHGRLGDSGRAQELFARIIELEPDHMMAHYNLGYTHLLSGRLPEAEEALARAAELAPDNFETLFHLGRTALELGHVDRALAALKTAGDLPDCRPTVYRLLGEALLLAHDHQGAAKAFKKAVKTSPNDAYALSALGALFVDLANDLEVARSLFQKSVEIDPTNSLYRQRLGRLLFNLGDFDGAEHHLTMAMEYGSRAPEVHFHLGRVAEEAGRREEALNHFKAALKQDPAYQPALERLHSPEYDPEAGWS